MPSAADAVPAATELRPLSVGELSRVVSERCASGGKVRIVGGRTSLPDGMRSSTQSPWLSTTGLTRVVDYPARDMTITVEAGLRVEELQRLLREQGQCLPVDVPEAHRATIGGALASNVSGPGRFGYGTFRDFLIGVRAVDGQGRLFAAGGRVVKNVAGYDLCKLLIGSRGRLAVIAELTFKLWPHPETRRLVWIQLPGWAAAEQALDGLATTVTRPVAVEVLNPPAAAALTRDSQLAIPEQGVVLCVGFAGTDRETDWQAAQLERELAVIPRSIIERIGPEDADDLWTALTEFPAASDAPATIQAAVLPSRVVPLAQFADARGLAVQVHAGSGVLVGHFPDGTIEVGVAAELMGELQARAVASGGSMQLQRCHAAWRSAFAPTSRVTALEQRLIRALDPHGIFESHPE